MVHYLRANHSEAGPQSVVVVDTEGTAVRSERHEGKHLHLLRAGARRMWRYENGQVTREQSGGFIRHDEFWEWLYSVTPRHRTTWIVGHGLSYDVQLLRIWEEIEEGRLVFTGKAKPLNQGPVTGRPPPVWSGCLVLTDPPTIVNCRTRDGRSLKFCDLRNWVNAPLPEIAELVGLKVPPRPGDVATDKDVVDYCEERVDIVTVAFRELVAMVREQALGQFRPTIAGQAQHAWRHPAAPCLVCASGDPEVRALERRAYFGGRTMVYFHGSVLHPGIKGVENYAGVDPFLPKGFLAPVYALDVVCCYGSVMRGNVFPCVHAKTLYEPTRDVALAHSAAYCTLADVIVDSKDVAFPVRKGEDVLYMVGRFQTTLAGPELRPALIAGHVKEVLRMECYVANRPFESFVERLWRIRQLYQLAGHRLKARLAKTMMAVLHGKLAQRNPRWQLEPGKLPLLPWGTFLEYDATAKRSVRYRAVGGVCQRMLEETEPEDGLPAIAAYVTSYARKHMELLRDEAMHHCVLYEDADSIHVNQEGLDRLRLRGWIDDQEMGKCRVVASADRAVYYGRKDYELGDHVVHCGIGRAATQSPRGDFLQEDFQRLDSVVMGRPPAGALSADRSARLHHELLGSASGPEGWTRYLIHE